MKAEDSYPQRAVDFSFAQDNEIVECTKKDTSKIVIISGYNNQRWKDLSIAGGQSSVSNESSKSVGKMIEEIFEDQKLKNKQTP